LGRPHPLRRDAPLRVARHGQPGPIRIPRAGRRRDSSPRSEAPGGHQGRRRFVL